MSDQTRYILWLDRGRQSPEEVGEIELHLTGWQGELYLDENRRPCPLVHYADFAFSGRSARHTWRCWPSGGRSAGCRGLGVGAAADVVIPGVMGDW